MKRLILLILIAASILVSGCTKPDGTQRVLKQQGFTDIQITGYRPFMCSDRDTFCTGFTAKGPNGDRVSGAVCSGWLKGATVRFD